MSGRIPYFAKILRLVKAIGLFLAHVAAAAIIFLVMWLLSKEFAYLGVVELFGMFPLYYVFDAGDLVLIVVLIYFAARDMIDELKG
jgi:hypothetical protein